MKTLIKFAIFLVLFFLPASEAWSEDEFDSDDCVITAIQPQFTTSDSFYRMGGLCNDVYPFTLTVSWGFRYRAVHEDFVSTQFGKGYLRADCPKDPVLFDDDCTNTSASGVHARNLRLISRDRLTQAQKAALKKEFDSLVPPPSIISPVAGEFYGAQNRVGDEQYSVPLQLRLVEPANRLSFRLLALLADESGQASMQEVLTKNASFFWTDKTNYESSLLLPPGVYALHATAKTMFMTSVESVASFTVGDLAKTKENLSAKALSRQIAIPRELASNTVKLDQTPLAPVSSTRNVMQVAPTPSYKQFTVISPRQDVRYTAIPSLKVFLPKRDDVIYALFQCAIPDDGRQCEHYEGGIAASDLQCTGENTNCVAEVSFNVEMPFEKAYELYVRPDMEMSLVEVNFELGAMAEHLSPQAVTSSPGISRDDILKARVATGVVVASIEQHTDPMVAGQPVDLKAWLKNMASVKSDAGLKYSVVCEVRSGKGACPFKDAVYTVDTQIAPGARHAVKLVGSVAQAGIYAITVAAPLPGKGEPFTGNSVTRIVEVIVGKSPIKRTAVKRVPD
jgi:hypothetical protein